ncbi:hypothetical protein HNY73_001713 [Argiope bruennichi]|uniref:DUF19 domain-containing protein n=2 Tax=Argiope bruennichi TaxID=94029 RepID=A0A8T0FXV9_ARGBR|nr:hypothetical protein HNY73_001713 [Argiope bruennichi]
MGFFILFIVSVLIGSVSCKNECFNDKGSRCVEKALTSDLVSDMDKNYCEVALELTKCLTETTLSCGMNFIPEANAVSYVVTEACKKGSDINQDFMAHEQCYVEVVKDPECYKPVFDVVKGKLTGREFLKGQKEACKLTDQVSKCLAEKARNRCGKQTVSFFEFLIHPIAELNKRVCEDVLIPADEEKGLFINAGLLGIFELITMAHEHKFLLFMDAFFN